MKYPENGLEDILSVELFMKSVSDGTDFIFKGKYDIDYFYNRVDVRFNRFEI